MPELLDRVSVVLVEPQNALNIGGALRATRNMGIADLRLVRPAEFDPARIAITAPGLDEEAAALKRYPTLRDALADGILALGFSARDRRASREVWPLDDLGRLVRDRLRLGEGRCHLVFGREDFGLSNDDLDCCHGMVRIPTDPGHPSLNLAQAVLLACHTVRRAALVRGGPAPVASGPAGRDDTPASSEAFEGLIDQIEQGLEYIEFFKYPGASTTVLRTLRVLLARAGPLDREVRTLRGIFAEIEAFCRRWGVPPPDARDEKPKD